MMQRYALLPFDQQGHEVVVKRLFKQAETRGDDELMAAFMVAFDRNVRRVRQKRALWDRDSRSSYFVEFLRTPRNVMAQALVKKVNPRTGATMMVAQRSSPKHRLFRYRTRYYLQRRVWRYFRKLGFNNAERYLSAIKTALSHYVDSDLSAGEHLMDSWSLLHALHGESASVEFGSIRASLKEGSTLQDLLPTPAFSKHWKSEHGASAALALIIGAQSKLTRTWGLAWHRELRKTIKVSPSTDDLMRMINHADEEVQSYGAALVVDSSEAANWTLTTWLKLLKCDNPRIAQLLSEAMLKHVSIERLDLAQCTELACAKAVPIARMGLEFLRQRQPQSASDRTTIAMLSRAECLGVGSEIAQWALSHLGREEAYEMPVVCRFFDSANASIRFGAWAWLTSEGSVGWKDATLWCRISETPYEDLRLQMIDALTLRATAPKLTMNDLAPVWTAVLLGIHRGGRQKLRAVKQIADDIAEHPQHHESLLPVLVTAVRSIRGPEARAALAAVLGLLARQPTLESAVSAALPELQLHPLEEAAA